MTTDTRTLSPAQRRLTLTSLVGQRVILGLGSGRDTRHDVVVEGPAVDGLNGESASETLLLCTAQADGRRIVFPMAAIVSYDQRQFALTDPRHPQYVQPERVVSSLPPRRSR